MGVVNFCKVILLMGLMGVMGVSLCASDAPPMPSLPDDSLEGDADGIPALSHAVGAKRVSGIYATNLDNYKNTLPRANYTWPEKHKERSDEFIWGHSTIRRLAYAFTYRIFQEIVQSTGASAEREGAQ
jgi:hypothetical protein